MKEMPACLTIAGLDPSGGAGVIADVKTFSAFECFATAAITSLTFQNTTGVFGALHQTSEAVRGQVEPILRDFKIAALKTGMLPTRDVIEETARLINEHKLKNVVVDPVVRSTSGFDLIDDAALRALVDSLFSLALVVTPNIPEAERITGMKLTNRGSIEKAGKKILSMGPSTVLIKGGHLQQAGKAVDYLFSGDDLTVFEEIFIKTEATHGTGCTLSAAITANLALGKPLEESIGIAKHFVHEAIRTAPHLGHGNSPINIRPI